MKGKEMVGKLTIDAIGKKINKSTNLQLYLRMMIKGVYSFDITCKFITLSFIDHSLSSSWAMAFSENERSNSSQSLLNGLFVVQ